MLRKVHFNVIDLAVSSFRLRSNTNELHLLKNELLHQILEGSTTLLGDQSKIFPTIHFQL